MSSDNSRDSFDALRDFAGVYLQQGRAVLDADWNEMVDIFERRMRAGTIDTIGRCVVPRETLEGFQIRITGGTDIEIGPGRLYLDGVLLENHGFANFDGTQPDRPDPVFDRGTDVERGGAGVLDEMIAPPEGQFLPYDVQPYWPNPDDLPGEPGAHLAYVVHWAREVTPVKDPSLLEPAMGGIDTCTRNQSVWQVRMLANVGDNATCETPEEDLDNWIETKAPSTARLSTATIDIEDPEDPCLVPPTEGYTGIENQLYRVELHSVEPGTPPTHFKYSRENASVAASIEGMTNPANSVRVTRIGRDDVLRFSAGDWVEITDDIREFDHRSGQMLRVASVNPETREITFEPVEFVQGDLIPSGADGDTFADRHTRLIRWDQNNIIRLADNSEWENLTAEGSNGLIPIPPAGTAVILESGITVTFDTADGPGQFRDMDFWRFAARTAGTQIEELRTAPPEGIQRHYCRLAIVRFPGSVQDCRVFWPPEFEGGDEEHGCGCTVCVTATSHASGVLTIQAAIDQVGPQGGTICLEAGNYTLDAPVLIDGRTAITLRGQGIGTVLLYSGNGGTIQVSDSVDVRLEEFSVLASRGDGPNDAGNITHGIAAVNTAFLSVRRIAVLLVSGTPSDSFDFAVALDGLQLGTQVRDCLIIAPHAIGSRSSYGLDQDGDLTFAAFAELRVEDNIMLGARVAMLFDRAAINLALAEFARNLVFGLQRGALIRFAELPAASTRVSSCTIISGRTALETGCTDLRVLDCDISGGEEVGDGILLSESLVPELGADAQIIGNNIFDLSGVGIHIDGPHNAILIKRNVIRQCDTAGILSEPDAVIRHIAIDNNVVEDIAPTGGQGDSGGILLGAAEGGQIIGNTVRGVGAEGSDGQAFVGIGVQAVGAFAVQSNGVSAIGPDRAEATSVAILIRPPYDGVIVSDNRIDGATLDTGTDFVAWTGIQIGPLGQSNPSGDQALGPPVLVNVASLPGASLRLTTYIALDDTLHRFGPGSYRATPMRGRSSLLSVTGNQIRCATRLLNPLVLISDAGTQSLSFGQNQCSLTGGGGLPTVVVLSAQCITMPGNTITHRSDSVSARLTAQAATPLGNITTSRILLNNNGLAAPYDALNILN